MALVSQRRRVASARPLDVAIVGGGISGLVTAYRLSQLRTAEAPVELRLFEAGERLGGVIRTRDLSTDERLTGTALCETGPDSIVTSKKAALDLCEELGLGEELIPPSSAATFSVVHRQRLHPMPRGFRLIAPTETGPLLRSRLFSWAGKARMLLEPHLERSSKPDAERPADPSAVASNDDESVERFVTRHFGREAYERVAEPVLGGLFVADATQLSAARTLGPFVALERRGGSVLRGLRNAPAPGAKPSAPAQMTLARGLESLVTRVAESIPDVRVELGCRVTQVRRMNGGLWRVETERGDWLARNVVLACPAPRCGDLLRGSLPVLSKSLSNLRFASVVTVNLLYRSVDLPRTPSDFGFFVPRGESNGILAVNFSSEKFAARAPNGWRLVRTFLGGALDARAVDLDDAQLIDRSHAELACRIGAKGPPVAAVVGRARDSMPQFDVGHLGRVANLEREIGEHPGLHLAGSALGAYGLPDCIASGEAIATSIQAHREGEAHLASGAF